MRVNVTPESLDSMTCYYFRYDKTFGIDEEEERFQRNIAHSDNMMEELLIRQKELQEGLEGEE